MAEVMDATRPPLVFQGAVMLGLAFLTTASQLAGVQSCRKEAESITTLIHAC
jgi:hypothetical protein